jgi:hypothetical protein
MVFGLARSASASIGGSRPRSVARLREGFVRTRRLLQLGIAASMMAGVAAMAPASSSAQPRSEPELRGRALLSATAYQPGPVSGTLLDPTPVNGVTPPFPGQPIPGFSAVIPAVAGNRSGNRLLAMPDNGFGAKTNSADFLLRAYTITPHYRRGGAATPGQPGEVAVEGFIHFRDPNHRVPFPIVHEDTSDRLLTGADFDIESLARDANGPRSGRRRGQARQRVGTGVGVDTSRTSESAAMAALVARPLAVADTCIDQAASEHSSAAVA